MSDEHEDLPPSDSAIQPRVDTSRRRFLGGAAVLGVGATLSACGNTSEAPSPPVTRPLTPQELDKALREQVKAEKAQAKTKRRPRLAFSSSFHRHLHTELCSLRPSIGS